MILTLFIIGAFVCAGSSLNLLTSDDPWQTQVVRTAGVLLGAAMMLAALYVRHAL